MFVPDTHLPSRSSHGRQQPVTSPSTWRPVFLAAFQDFTPVATLFSFLACRHVVMHVPTVITRVVTTLHSGNARGADKRYQEARGERWTGEDLDVSSAVSQTSCGTPLDGQ